MRADGKRLEHKFNRVELEGGDGTIAGYASVFGAVDLGRDAVERAGVVEPARFLDLWAPGRWDR